MTARFVLDIVSTIIWLPLELLVISTLLRGPYRRFPFLLAFLIAEFLAVAAEIPAYWAVYRHVQHAASQRWWLYLLDEVILQVLIYAVVISLIYQASAHLKSRRAVAFGLVLFALLFAGGDFLVHHGPNMAISDWLTPWTRDLNFCSAILDLGLWTLLISSRKKGQGVLLLSGGLGIRFTGEAIGDSIRQLAFQHKSRPLSFSANLLVDIVHLLCLYIWWQALREKSPEKLAAKAASRPAETL